MTEPVEGICVAYDLDGVSHFREGLVSIITHAMAHDGYVGGWLDPRDSSYCFDSVRLFPEDELEEALEFARENRQEAVYILSSGEEIIFGFQ